MPHCQAGNTLEAEAEYFWILLQPANATTTATLRTLVLDGLDQLSAWTDEAADTGAASSTVPVLTLTDRDGADHDYHAYRTISQVLCGDSVRPGLGGQYLSFTLQGEP